MRIIIYVFAILDKLVALAYRQTYNCVFLSSINSLRKQTVGHNGILFQCRDPFTFYCIIK